MCGARTYFAHVCAVECLRHRRRIEFVVFIHIHMFSICFFVVVCCADFAEPMVNRFATRRKSVFAEAYDPENDPDDADGANAIFPKSDEQRTRLIEAVQNILLFRALEPDQVCLCVSVCVSVGCFVGGRSSLVRSSVLLAVSRLNGRDD